MRNCVPILACLLLCILAIAQCQDINKVMFVSLDGFRYDYIDIAFKKGRNVSAFVKLWKDGFRAEVQNVMTTITFPSHYSMATGRTTEHHGLVGNTFFDPKINESYSYKDKIDSMDSRFYDYANAEPIWLTNQRHNNKRTGVFYWPGSDARIGGKMAFATYGLYKDDANFGYRVDRIMDWLPRPEFSLCMLYFNEPDSAGHRYGPYSDQVLDAIELVNDGIAYLMQRIEQNEATRGKVNIIVGSDHGMMEVGTETIWQAKVFEQLEIGVDYDGDSSGVTLGLWPKGEQMKK